MTETTTPDALSASVRVEHIYISPGHSYFGRHGQGAADHAMIELESIQCVEGSGLRGDRFFDYKADYAGQVTFFAREVFEELCRAVGAPGISPSAVRRNILVSGVDLNELIGREFELQDIRFVGERECSPCYWMDEAVGPGAAEFLKGRGGLRARILSSGTLRRER